MAAEALKKPESGGRRGRRREEVLLTAARIFGEMGYRGATLEDIARALNITQPALYYYARSKDELLTQCGEVAVEGLEEAARLAEQETVGLEQLKTFFRHWTPVICGDFGRCFILTDPRDLPEVRRTAQAANIRRFNEAVDGMISRGIADGSIALQSTRELRQALFSVFNNIARWYRRDGNRTMAEIVEDLLVLFVDGVRPRT